MTTPSAPNLFADIEDTDDEVGGTRPKGKYYGEISDDYVYMPPTRSDRNPRQADYYDQGGGVVVPTYKTENDEDFRILQNLGPEALADVQDALGQLGLIKPTQVYRRGVVDNVTRKAFQNILGYANQNGLTDWREAFASYAQSVPVRPDGKPVVGDGSGGARGGAQEVDPGRVTSTTSALTLEEQLQQAATSRLGRKLRKNEITKFVTVYQGMEGSFNSTAASMQDDAAVTGVDASIEEIPSADVAANQFVDANYAQEEAGQSSYGYLEALRGLLGGS